MQDRVPGGKQARDPVGLFSVEQVRLRRSTGPTGRPGGPASMRDCSADPAEPPGAADRPLPDLDNPLRREPGSQRDVRHRAPLVKRLPQDRTQLPLGDTGQPCQVERSRISPPGDRRQRQRAGQAAPAASRRLHMRPMSASRVAPPDGGDGDHGWAGTPATTGLQEIHAPQLRQLHAADWIPRPRPTGGSATGTGSWPSARRAVQCNLSPQARRKLQHIAQLCSAQRCSSCPR